MRGLLRLYIGLLFVAGCPDDGGDTPTSDDLGQDAAAETTDQTCTSWIQANTYVPTAVLR